MAAGTVQSRSRAAHLGPERRRPQVLDAALAIAIERGVAAVTIGAVAERLDVTRPVVYSCFADRVELLHALLDRENDILLGEATSALPHDRPEGDEALFVAGFQALLAAVDRRPDSWRLMMSADPDPATAEQFQNGRAAIANQFAKLLRPRLKHWGTTDFERKLPVLAEQFMSACEGAVRTLLRDSGHDWSPGTLGEFIGSAVYRAFRAA
ncbi:MAG TPA: TetR/AcrR family transcriptional regulator [Mycobacterium sp.]|uniref:TetR/AcrR family transcriptional regulator n=1 Tax=Mycobacterium sp. TaxID=1785 RepID=UPI002D448B5E|nr:TetR/AcrR family transcriptional regulator [Mycobacterium sp.]HXY63123.1 TetR/AcrR family transcriptional regulator [Mycobacterium sp.]